jgi:hypothetical protein
MAILPFPLTPVLDSGVRADENPIVGWTKPIFTAGNNSLRIVSNTIRAVAAPASNYLTRQPFGPDQEVHFTLALEDAGTFVHVPFCLHGTLPDTGNGYLLNISSAANTITVEKMTNGGIAAIGAAIAQTIANGDSFGARRIGNEIEVWYKAAAGVWTRLATRTDATWRVNGRIGLILISATQQITNFGGGGISALEDYAGWTVTRGSVGATLNDQPTFAEYTFDDKTVRKDWK